MEDVLPVDDEDRYPGVASEARETPQYEEGARAFYDGMHPDECPYAQGSYDPRRVSWFLGYYDHRTRSNIGKNLDYYGMTFP